MMNRVFKNISWLLISKIVSSITGFLVSVLVTRYLGPEQRGPYAHAVAIASFFGFLSIFGLGDILIKEYSANVDRAKNNAITASILMGFGGFCSFCLAIIMGMLFKVDETTMKCIILYSIQFLFGSINVIEYWLYSQAQTKAYTICQGIVHAIFLGVRLIGIYWKVDVVWFIGCMLAEQIVLRIVLVAIYNLVCVKMRGELNVTFSNLKRMFKLSFPMLLTGVTTSIYMKIDQIMVGYLLTDEDAGIYSVAVHLAEYWYFIPGVIYMSFLPLLTEVRDDKERFRKNLLKMGDILITISYVVIVGVLILGTYAINLVYGEAFYESAHIIKIYILSGLFTSLSFVGQAYFILRDNTKIILYIQVLGAVLNMVLNAILIPIYGMYGAAYATVLEYMIVALGQMIILMKKYNELYLVELKCLFPFIRMGKMLAKKIKKK